MVVGRWSLVVRQTTLTNDQSPTTNRPMTIQDPVLSLLSDLVAINSVNPTLVAGAPGEGAVAESIAHTMRRAGLDVEVQEAAPGRPNVIGVLEGSAKGPALMFCGHTDTVGTAGMDQPFTPV